MYMIFSFFLVTSGTEKASDHQSNTNQNQFVKSHNKDPQIMQKSSEPAKHGNFSILSHKDDGSLKGSSPVQAVSALNQTMKQLQEHAKKLGKIYYHLKVCNKYYEVASRSKAIL